MNSAHRTYQEIISQPEAWTQALHAASCAPLPRADSYGQVLFTGCGSTFYLSLAAASLYQQLTCRPSRAVAAGELLLNPDTVMGGAVSPALLIAFSRSGTTTETLRVAEAWKTERRGQLMMVGTCDGPLARMADVAVLIDKAQEESVAQTRAFSAMYLAAVVLSARMAGNSALLDSMAGLPESGSRLLRLYEAPMRQLGANLLLNRFYFLGSGMLYGLACEANLKMKEMTLTDSEPFPFLEFRHGPMSMVDSSTVVVGLVSERNRNHEMTLLQEMRRLGATTLTLAETEADVALQSGMPESARGVLYLPALQLMAFHRAVAKGLNPDRPRYLSAAVHLDL
jgi:glucosamine--fructose-6-phosphate aminotransferase (isomerizing)